jgi:DNA invertase Pin-like site-specific DNA recombinase
VIAAIYARVSTEKQDYTGQIADLKAFAKRNEWTVAEYFEKESAKVGSNRPVHKLLMAQAAVDDLSARARHGDDNLRPRSMDFALDRSDLLERMIC